MSNTWTVVVAGLGTAALSTFGAFGLNWKRSTRARNIAKHNELKDSCVIVLSGANQMALKSAALRTNMFARSGVGEGLDVVLRLKRPVDVLELSEYMFAELGPVMDAVAKIWLMGDERLIRSAGDIVLAISQLIDNSTALPNDRTSGLSSSPLNNVKTSLRGLKSLTSDEDAERQRMNSLKALSRQCALFGRVMRERIGTKDIDAILRAHPALQVSRPRFQLLTYLSRYRCVPHSDKKLASSRGVGPNVMRAVRPN